MKFFESLEEIINNEVKNGAFPGANYVLLTENKIYIGSTGNKRLLPKEEKNSLDTIYDMASLTKVIVTTTCIYKLIELGKLRTSTKVQYYLPRFKHPNITVWNLLTHTSGLPEGVSGLFDIKSRDELIDKIYSLDLKYETGVSIKYSDVGFILLGFIIEEIMQQSLDAVARRFIFDPLEMHSSGYNPEDKMRCAPTEDRNDSLYQGILQGTVHDETAYLLGGVAGHAGLFTTAEDVAKFIQMILNDGKYKDKQVLSKELIALMKKPQVFERSPLYNKPDLIRGLGWLIGGMNHSCGDLVSDNTIHHTGFTGTNLWIDFDRKLGFCLLSNRVHPTRKNIKHFDARGRIANYIIANIDKLEEE